MHCPPPKSDGFCRANEIWEIVLHSRVPVKRELGMPTRLCIGRERGFASILRSNEVQRLRLCRGDRWWWGDKALRGSHGWGPCEHI